MRNSKLVVWEKRLKLILDELDDIFEDRFASKYSLHPARPYRGKTSNKAHDGLFNITAKYTLGLGSKCGEGYSLDIHLSTLSWVDPEDRVWIKEKALQYVQKRLPEVFTENKLEAAMDGNAIKVFGDLTL